VRAHPGRLRLPDALRGSHGDHPAELQQAMMRRASVRRLWLIGGGQIHVVLPPQTTPRSTGVRSDIRLPMVPGRGECSRGETGRWQSRDRVSARQSSTSGR
jgi:hypothetical protein